MKTTTKVVGVVLTLLVAALFTGAAAASDDYGLGDVYVYACYNATDFAGIDLSNPNHATWSYGSNSITFNAEPKESNYAGMYSITGDNIVPGKYTLSIEDKTYNMNVKYPTAQVVGTIYTEFGELADNLIGNAVADNMKLSFNKPNDKYAYGLQFTNPDGTLSTYYFADVDYSIAGNNFGIQIPISSVDKGQWTVQALYKKNESGISAVAPASVLGQAYHFTVVKAETSYKLEEIGNDTLQGNYVTIVAKAPASTLYGIEVTDYAMIPAGQTNVELIPDGEDKTVKRAYLKVGTSGEQAFSVKAVSSDDFKVRIYELNATGAFIKNKKEISVKVNSGKITAKYTNDKYTVYIGNEIDIEGTSDFGGETYIFVKGSNFPMSLYEAEHGSGKEWSMTLDTSNLINKVTGKKADADTYEVYAVSVLDGVDYKNLTKDDLNDAALVKDYATLPLQLKAAFIILDETPVEVAQGEELLIKGTAEGSPADVLYYVFGTNYFNYATSSVDSDNRFEVKLTKSMTDTMETGEYFVVIQHPMYDHLYNIAPVGNYYDGFKIVLNKTHDVLTVKNGETLFYTNKKQTENAAKALCNQLDHQDIDDMYVKLSINVVDSLSTINPIAPQINKGQVLTVSGNTRGHKDEIVLVKIGLGGNFADKTKQESSSDSLATSGVQSVKIGEDGAWNVSFDTSNLVAGDYVCSVTVGSESSVSNNFKIVDSGAPVTPVPTVGPTNPGQPTVQPTTVKPTATTPVSPGFGALAALAGLGAVAVLLLRRE